MWSFYINRKQRRELPLMCLTIRLRFALCVHQNFLMYLWQGQFGYHQSKRPFGVFVQMTNFRSISSDNALSSRLFSVIVLSFLIRSSNIAFESGRFFFSQIFLIDDKIFTLIELNESVSLTSFVNVPSSLISLLQVYVNYY